MRIAVIGAGIAGLVAACSLQRDGHDVTVYEQREHPNADGAGLTLFGNAFAALDAVDSAVEPTLEAVLAADRAARRVVNERFGG